MGALGVRLRGRRAARVGAARAPDQPHRRGQHDRRHGHAREGDGRGTASPATRRGGRGGLVLLLGGQRPQRHELLPHLMGRRIAVAGLLGHGAGHDRVRAATHRVVTRKPGDRRTQVRQGDVDLAAPVRRRTRHGGPEQATEGVDVGGEAGRRSGLPLRGEVLESADHPARGRRLVAVGARDAEVAEIGVELAAGQPAQQDVGRLEIAVHDPVGVRLLQARGHLLHDVRGLPW